MLWIVNTVLMRLELIQMAVIRCSDRPGQRGLPVVAVDDVRLKVGVEQHLQMAPEKRRSARRHRRSRTGRCA